MPWVSGTAIFVLMLGLAVYGVKRRTMRLPWGKAYRWRAFHVYGGLVFLPLLLWHGGFTVPPGAVDSWLWILSVWVFLSGLVGIGVQHWIPKALAGGVDTEVVYERIPEVVTGLRDKARDLVAGAPETVREFYRDNLARSMEAPEVRWSYFVDVTGGVESRTRQFVFLRKHTDSQHQELVSTLEGLYQSKLECDAHFTLQKALRWWMWLHFPPSIALTLLAFLHLYLVIRY